MRHLQPGVLSVAAETEAAAGDPPFKLVTSTITLPL